jgi:hypothetical protein
MEQYQELFEDKEDLQVQWEAAVDHHELGVGLLIGQLDDENLRAINDEENCYNTGHYAKMKNFVSLPITRSKSTGVF